MTRKQKVKNASQGDKTSPTARASDGSVTKIKVPYQKTDFRAKILHFWPKNLFFLSYARITHFFGLCQTRLNGIISSPCPQVTLDTFGFLVGARWAARRAVFWPDCPKWPFLGLKMVFLDPSGRPGAHRATSSIQKPCPYGVLSLSLIHI